MSNSQLSISDWQKIKLVLVDVDGVLSKGSLLYTAEGETIKSFHVRDGFGIVQLQNNGIPVGVITGRDSPALQRRLKDLKISIVHVNVKDKLSVYQKIRQELSLDHAEIAYMGDDIPDVSILRYVGIPSCPKDAVPEVLDICKFISPCKGGKGAVRSLAEQILKAQGKWIVESHII